MMIDLYGLPCDGTFNLIFLNDFQAFLILNALSSRYDSKTISDVERAELKSMLACIGGALLDTCT